MALASSRMFRNNIFTQATGKLINYMARVSCNGQIVNLGTMASGRKTGGKATVFTKKVNKIGSTKELGSLIKSVTVL